MIPGNISVMLAVEPIDMRRSFDGLSKAVQEQLGCDPKVESTMFVFVNRRRDMLKVLWRDQTGWCLLAKRLDEREVALPKGIAAGAKGVRVDARALVAMLDGVVRRRGQTVRAVVHEARAASDQVRSDLRRTQPNG